jgi:hypothetical protein
MMDRREFVKHLCALTGTLILPVGCSQENSTALNLPGESAAFSKTSFENAIDTVFSVTHDVHGVVDLRLNLVADEMPIAEAEQFSISLSGPDLPVLEEGSYAVYNDNFGDIALYIQPGQNNGGLQHYVAMFSLLHA